ncbi:hypothetical protein [Pseudomonas capsici]|nr:hypothetical protein [Pseudomonas capsici]MCV4283307.1 hypothetical protein [Pseudomonas capsici]
MSGLSKGIAVSGGACRPFIPTATPVLTDNWLEPGCMEGCL